MLWSNILYFVTQDFTENLLNKIKKMLSEKILIFDEDIVMNSTRNTEETPLLKAGDVVTGSTGNNNEEKLIILKRDTENAFGGPLNLPPATSAASTSSSSSSSTTAAVATTSPTSQPATSPITFENVVTTPVPSEVNQVKDQRQGSLSVNQNIEEKKSADTEGNENSEGITPLAKELAEAYWTPADEKKRGSKNENAVMQEQIKVLTDYIDEEGSDSSVLAGALTLIKPKDEKYYKNGDEYKQDVDSFKAVQQALIRHKMKESCGTYQFYHVHAWLGLIGEVPYAAFTFYMNTLGMTSISKFLFGYSNDDVNWVMNAAMTTLSFIANAPGGYHPRNEAEGELKRSIYDPNDTIKSTVCKKPIVAIGTGIHFMIGACADLVPFLVWINKHAEDPHSPGAIVGQSFLALLLLYVGVSYYTLFNGKDILGQEFNTLGKVLPKIAAAFTAGNKTDALTGVYVFLLQMLTALYRCVSFGYLGWKMIDIVANNRAAEISVSAIAAIVTAWPAVACRFPDIMKRWYSKGDDEDFSESDLHAAIMLYNAESSLSLKTFIREALWMIPSPSTCISVPAAYIAADALSPYSLPLRIAGGTVAGLASHLFMRQVVLKPAYLVKMARDIYAERKPDPDKDTPNWLATFISGLVNAADQLSRTIGFTAAFRGAFYGDEEYEGMSSETKAAIFLVALMIALGNYEYQNRKTEQALIAWIKSWFAKPKPTLPLEEESKPTARKQEVITAAAAAMRAEEKKKELKEIKVVGAKTNGTSSNGITAAAAAAQVRRKRTSSSSPTRADEDDGCCAAPRTSMCTRINNGFWGLFGSSSEEKRPLLGAAIPPAPPTSSTRVQSGSRS